jgi:hypothetical protein
MSNVTLSGDNATGGGVGLGATGGATGGGNPGSPGIVIGAASGGSGTLRHYLVAAALWLCPRGNSPRKNRGIKGKSSPHRLATPAGVA